MIWREVKTISGLEGSSHIAYKVVKLQFFIIPYTYIFGALWVGTVTGPVVPPSGTANDFIRQTKKCFLMNASWNICSRIPLEYIWAVGSQVWHINVCDKTFKDAL
jgi:hypothetical protein